jgi:uncharacterized RmlC-like cupin family protein
MHMSASAGAILDADRVVARVTRPPRSPIIDDECAVVRAQAQPSSRSRQGHTVFPGISAQCGGSTKISAVMVVVAPGERGKAHRHDDHETIYHVLEGRGIHWYGDRLQHKVIVEKGDFFYVPAGVPHLPMNASDTDPIVAVAARSDANSQEDVVLMPELDDLPHLNPETALFGT